jgi:hypothetical protein
MKASIIVTGYNRSGINPKTGRPWVDATGAFLPEAAAFRKLHSDTVRADGHDLPTAGWLEFVAPLTPARRRGLTESAIRSTSGLDVVAVFGHGISTRLLATGHGLAEVLDLAAAIHASGARTVVLYACSTAAGRVGFADELAAALPGVNVWGHTSAGHTSWNPNTELAGGPRSGDPVARPGEPLWKRWRERMANERDFRLSFWLPAHGLDRTAALEAVRASV